MTAANDRNQDESHCDGDGTRYPDDWLLKKETSAEKRENRRSDSQSEQRPPGTPADIPHGLLENLVTDAESRNPKPEGEKKFLSEFFTDSSGEEEAERPGVGGHGECVEHATSQKSRSGNKTDNAKGLLCMIEFLHDIPLFVIPNSTPEHNFVYHIL
jgi:hypothetical protein